MDPLTPLLVVTIVLIISLVMTEVFNRIKTSVFIGLVLGGAFIGLPIFDQFVSQGQPIIDSMSVFGIILLLFISGLQADYRKLKESKKEEGMVALLGAIIPFILGFAITRALDYGLVTAFIVGASLSITSAGTTIGVLLETKTLNTRVGKIILGAGIIDDIFEVIFLSVLIVLVQHGEAASLAVLPFRLFVFTLIILTFFKLILPKIIKHIVKEENHTVFTGFIITLCFITTLISYFLGLGYIIGAFLAGLVIQLLIKNKIIRTKMITQIRNFSFALIIPFFFINLGLQLDIGSIEQYFPLFLIVFGVAVMGKVGGALLTKPFTKLNWKQLHLIGWGMNSRGAVELVITEIARSSLGLPIEVFSVLVLTTITTTIIFPFVLRNFVGKYPHIMQ